MTPRVASPPALLSAFSAAQTKAAFSVTTAAADRGASAQNTKATPVIQQGSGGAGTASKYWQAKGARQ